MQFSEQWLREWTNPAINTSELVEQLTLNGLEVDATQAAAPPFSGVVIAQIISVEAHPNAEKLNICHVKSHSEASIQVVCGAPNVAVGMRVPFATVGAKLSGDFTIKKAKLRGIESFGMLCSASELGLGDDHSGLLRLPEDAPIGEDFFAYLKLDDTLIDVDLTPNRGDCLSIRGLAREVSASYQTPIHAPVIETISPQTEDQLTVIVDAPQDCPCYVGRVIRHVRADAMTPLWLSERLRRSGIRTVHAVVDILNYVMLELGQPMHGFDLNTLQGNVRVRHATGNESLTLLDTQVITPDAGTLLITDDEQILALAGIMGSQSSGIEPSTHHIFLESAFFTPESIIGRARKLGLHTDASHRYERGVDPQLQHQAIERATGLILAICGGEPGIVSEQRFQAHMPLRNTIVLRRTTIQKKLGIAIADTHVETALTALGLQVFEHESGWQVTAPSWRFDLSIEMDLIEEVGRLYGYDRLPKEPYVAPLLPQPLSKQDRLLERMKHAMVGQGYYEAINYSFIDPAQQAQFAPETSGIHLANPISSEMSVMRTSLLPGLVRNALYNTHRQQPRVRLFEAGQVFLGQVDNAQQRLHFAAVLSGARLPQGWANDSEAVDFFDIKGDLERLLQNSQCADYRFTPAEHSCMHPGQCAAIYQQDRILGYVGALHPKLQKAQDLDKPLYLFELDLERLNSTCDVTFLPLSRYPQVQRDLAIVVEQSVLAADVVALSRQAGGDSLRCVRLFDQYQGAALGNKQSLALRLTFQHPERTLEEREITQAMEQIMEQLHATFQAQLRQ